jgi:hypothetical protein
MNIATWRRQALDATAKQTAIKAAGVATGAVILAIFLAVVYPNSKPFPWTDDWTFLFASSMSWGDFVGWLFAQHNDHRIPIVKAVQYAILANTGFDFRVTILLNACIVLGAAAMLFDVCRRYRGSWHFGDLIAPLIIANLGFGAFGWGFAMQFALNVALGIAFVWLAMAGRLGLAYAALVANALTGLSGIVITTVVCLVMLRVSLSLKQMTRRKFEVAMPLGVLAFSVLLWLCWSPSPASGGPSFSNVIGYLYGLSKSSLVVNAFHGEAWKSAALTALVAVGLWFAVTGLRRSPPETENPVYALFVALLAICVAVAVGRSQHSPWTPGLEMHYGYLVSPLPILAWLVISRKARPMLANVLGTALLLLYANAFLANANWRTGYIRSAAPKFAEVSRMIRDGTPVDQIMQAHMPQLYYVDTPDTRYHVSVGVERLRQVGGPLFRH